MFEGHWHSRGDVGPVSGVVSQRHRAQSPIPNVRGGDIRTHTGRRMCSRRCLLLLASPLRQLLPYWAGPGWGNSLF